MFCLIFTAVCALLTLGMIDTASRVTGHYAYEDISRTLFGPRAAVVVQIVIIVMLAGSCVIFVILYGDLFVTPMKHLLPENIPSWVVSERFIMAVCCVLVYPLCLLKDMHALRLERRR